MKVSKDLLLDELISDVSLGITNVNIIISTDKGALVKKPSAGEWSVVEIIEHLNSYNDYYLPRIANKLLTNGQNSPGTFQSGFLGDYFVKMMQPGANDIIAKKYKAARQHVPVISKSPDAVIEQYLKEQQYLLALLDNARNADLNTIKIPISIAPFMKIRLGDIFRFIIAHQNRHVVQMRKVVERENLVAI